VRGASAAARWLLLLVGVSVVVWLSVWTIVDAPEPWNAVVPLATLAPAGVVLLRRDWHLVGWLLLMTAAISAAQFAESLPLMAPEWQAWLFIEAAAVVLPELHGVELPDILGAEVADEPPDPDDQAAVFQHRRDRHAFEALVGTLPYRDGAAISERTVELLNESLRYVRPEELFRVLRIERGAGSSSKPCDSGGHPRDSVKRTASSACVEVGERLTKVRDGGRNTNGWPITSFWHVSQTTSTLCPGRGAMTATPDSIKLLAIARSTPASRQSRLANCWTPKAGMTHGAEHQYE
jgi:hypothetical protein